MNEADDGLGRRRRFLLSGLSVLGYAAAGIVLSGCSDDKSAGQVENPGDVTKTPDAQDSMKAYMQQMQTQKGKNPAGRR